MESSESKQGEVSVYEAGYLILPSIPEDKLSSVVEAVKAAFIEEGGVEIDSEDPFKQNLAYSISKTVGSSRYVINDAYLGWVKFELDKSKISAVKTSLEKMNELARFILLKAPRETLFTFAKARALAEAELAAEEEVSEEVGAEKEAIVE